MSTSDKMTGKAKETVGKATGNEELEAEGKAQNAKGKLKESTGNVGDKARGAMKGITGDDAKR